MNFNVQQLSHPENNVVPPCCSSIHCCSPFFQGISSLNSLSFHVNCMGNVSDLIYQFSEPIAAKIFSQVRSHVSLKFCSK